MSILALGALIMSVSADAAKNQATTDLSTPSVVGPDPIFVCTDTKFFSTSLKVNGVDVELADPNNDGSERLSDKWYQGPMGGPNQKVINSYLKEGSNKIEILFELSSIYLEMKRDGFEGAIKPQFAAFVVKASDQWGVSMSGDSTAKLTEFLEKAKSVTKLLKHEQFEVVSGQSPMPQYRVEYSLNVSAKDGWQVAQSAPENCKWEASRPTLLNPKTGEMVAGPSSTGTLSVNGQVLFEIKGRESIRISKPKIQPGLNEIRYEVTQLGSLPERLRLNLICELRPFIDKIGSPYLKSLSSQTGDFFSERKISLLDIIIEKPGIYTSSFKYRAP